MLSKDGLDFAELVSSGTGGRAEEGSEAVGGCQDSLTNATAAHPEQAFGAKS